MQVVVRVNMPTVSHVGLYLNLRLFRLELDLRRKGISVREKIRAALPQTPSKRHLF